MGYDAVVDSAKLNRALTVTAEAIRSKANSTDPITFDMDEGFKSSVEGIASGGVDTSADTVTPSTLVKDYTAHDAEGKQIVGELDLEVVKDEGYTEGHAAGYAEGHEVGEAEGFEAGKQELHELYWGEIQMQGARTSYNEAFRRWDDELFKPLYSFNIEAGQRMFQNAEIKNLKTTLEQRGLAFDTSKATALTQMFQSCASTELPFIDASLATNTSYAFAGRFLISLHIRVSEVTRYSSTFIYTGSLKSLNLEGTIGQNGFDVSWSPLNKASLTSIVNALSATTTGLTVTLRLDAVNKAFETSEGAMDGSTSDEWLALAATKPNWTISLINS